MKSTSINCDELIDSYHDIAVSEFRVHDVVSIISVHDVLNIVNQILEIHRQFPLLDRIPYIPSGIGSKGA